MSIQDNYAKSWDGMFTRVSPRLDAVEEISMGTAAGSASDASQGSIQVRFVTRSGTNQWKGSVYYYYRDDVLNSNTWFNKNYNVSSAGVQTAKPVTHQDQPGGRIGGPIIKDKAFFFVNYEWVSSPGTSGRLPTVMSPSSEQGIFLYNSGNSSVNLMQLAASKGQTSTIDPLIAKTIAAMRSSMSQGTLNATTDPATQQLSWQLPTKSKTTYPTVRLDYNLTSKHRISASGTYNHLISDPDTTNTYYVQYPGFPNRGTQDSERYSTQLSMRSTLSQNLVNEVRFGMTGGATMFFPENNTSMFSDYGGYALGFSAFRSIANPYSTASNSSREGSTKVLEDTVTWMKGKHSISTGMSFTQANVWLKNQQFVPTSQLRHRHRRPGRRDVHDGQFPRSVEHRPEQRPGSLRRADRAGLLDRPERAHRRGWHHLQHPGGEPAEGPPQRVRYLFERLVADPAEPDDQRRLALRAGAAVLRPEQQLLERRHRGGHGRHRDRAGL